MVTHSMVNQDIRNTLVHIFKIARQLIIVFVPIQIPCHITEGDCIHLLVLVRIPIVVPIIGESRELGQVFRPVCKMHVTEEEHLVFVLVIYLFQDEVFTLCNIRFLFQCRKHLRKDTLRCRLITRRD